MTKQYGAAARCEAMQLSAEIIVDEEINEVEFLHVMYKNKFQQAKSCHVFLGTAESVLDGVYHYT